MNPPYVLGITSNSCAVTLIKSVLQSFAVDGQYLTREKVSRSTYKTKLKRINKWVGNMALFYTVEQKRWIGSSDRRGSPGWTTITLTSMSHDQDSGGAS